MRADSRRDVDQLLAVELERPNVRALALDLS